jgi:hypothetical protein
VSVASQSCCFTISSHVLPFPCNINSYLVMSLLISFPCWVFSSSLPLPYPHFFFIFPFLPFLLLVPLQICFCAYYLTLLSTPSISNSSIHLIQWNLCSFFPYVPFVTIVVHFFHSRNIANINTGILLKIENCKEGFLHTVKPTNAPVLKLHILHTVLS